MHFRDCEDWDFTGTDSFPCTEYVFGDHFAAAEWPLLRSALNDRTQVLHSQQGNKVEQHKEFTFCCG